MPRVGRTSIPITLITWSTFLLSIVPLIPIVIMMGGSTSHPNWDTIGLRLAQLSIF